jgi:superfamily II DNA or RNA helicase
MKAVLSNRIYMDVTPEFEEHLDKELTYKIPSYNEEAPPTVIRNMSLVRPGIVTIPIGRTDLIPSNYEIVDKRIKSPCDFPDFKFSLRPSQQEVYDALNDNAIINAWVSWGKTFTGLAIAGKLKQKTLIVTHTIPLRNQWARETEKVYGFSPSVIGSGSFDMSKPITVANTQTLYRNIPKVSREFGTIILDEMHHVSSPTFSKVLDSNYARYKIGLSGTLLRKDGKHVVFRDYFSNNIFKPPKENYMVPEIHIAETGIRFMDGANIPWANRVNNLTQTEEYKVLVTLLARKYADQGHKVLVLSDRVEFLETISKMIGDKAVAVTGKVKGDRESIINSINFDKDVICGTQQIFSEGISQDSLSCLILATPVNNESLLTQLVGRVVREKKGKQTPVIVDLKLIGKTATRQFNSRLGVYMKEGYKVTYL